MGIDTLSKVTIYEIDGEETKMLDSPVLLVKNHWNNDEMVRLRFGKKIITVLARDLMDAIRNATR